MATRVWRESGLRFFKVGPLSLLLVSLVLSFLVGVAGASDSPSGPGKYLSKTSGICAIGANTSRVYASRNAETPLIPASLQKLLVTATALDQLGALFTTSTEVFVLGEVAGPTPPLLYVRAGLDAGLTTERLYLLARAVRGLGIKRVKELAFDDSNLLDPTDRLGARAYLSGVSAFGVNWNSYTVRACAAESRGRDAIVSIDPSESGVRITGSVKAGSSTSFAASEVRPGTVNASGVVARGKCAEEYVAAADVRGYTAAVVSGIFRDAGVEIVATSWRTVPTSATKVLSFPSRPLEELIKDMNYFSNNNMAEMFTALLGGSGGRYSRSAGLKLIQSSVLPAGQRGNPGGRGAIGAKLVDGSGLDTENRLTVQILCRVLAAQYRNPDSRTTFFAALPQFGVSGTLKKRLAGISGRAKTGSLSNVSSLAGVLYGRSEPVLFAIIQNEVADLGKAKLVEEKVIAELSEL